LRKTPSAIPVGLAALAVLVAAPMTRAALSPALERELDRLAPGADLGVIITLARQVDDARYTGRPADLIRALRHTARLTQGPVADGLTGPVRRFWLTNALATRASATELLRLAADPAVAHVDLDPRVRVLGGRASALEPFPDPGEGGWGVAAIGAPGVWRDYGITGAGVRVGSIDTGVDPRNPDLQGRIGAWRDFIAGGPTPYDDHGHGTHTAGTMVGGSARGQAIGVAPGAQLVVAKTMRGDGAGSGSAILDAAQWMADPDGNAATPDQPAVVNNSWGSGDPSDTWFRPIVRRWRALGIVGVFSAGNSGPDPSSVESPASYPESLAVGATDRDGVVAGFSSRGPVAWTDDDGTGPASGTLLVKPDLVAPGVAVVSTVGTGYLAYSGTSMAAAHVSGVVALVKQASPSLGGVDIEDILRRSLQDLGAPGPDPDAGWGLLSARAAVEAALGPVPDTTFTLAPRAVTHRRTLSYRVALTGATAYRSRVDGGPWGPPSSDPTLQITADEGHHLVEAQAVSPSGVPDPHPSRHQVTVDLTPPVVSFTWRATGRRVRFFARAIDRLSGPDASSLVWRFGDGATARGRAVAHAFEPDAPRRARVSVRDRAGNRAAHSRTLGPRARVMELPLVRSVRTTFRTPRGARTLLIRGRLTRPARVRVTLSVAAAGPHGTRKPVAAGGTARRVPGAFRITLRLKGVSPGGYRLAIAAAEPGDRRLTPRLSRRVLVAPVRAIKDGARP
jgi:bacillopeptidase F